MTTRGKRHARNAPGNASTAVQPRAKRPRVPKSSSRSRIPASRSMPAPVQAINPPAGQHPSELSRQPSVQNRQVSSGPASPSSALPDLVPSLSSVISNTVIQSLTAAGIIPAGETSSEPVTAVQGSVAQVVNDLTGEGHSHNSSNIFHTILDRSETDIRPEKVHSLISVPLSSRVPDKIQSKIWANEYVDLGILLCSLPNDPKYNFTVKSAQSNHPVVSLEPVQNTKRISTIDQWTSAF